MYFFAVNRLFLFGDFVGRQNEVFELMTSANSNTRFHKIKNDSDADRMKLIFISTSQFLKYIYIYIYIWNMVFEKFEACSSSLLLLLIWMLLTN